MLYFTFFALIEAIVCLALRRACFLPQAVHCWLMPAWPIVFSAATLLIDYIESCSWLGRLSEPVRIKSGDWALLTWSSLARLLLDVASSIVVRNSAACMR